MIVTTATRQRRELACHIEDAASALRGPSGEIGLAVRRAGIKRGLCPCLKGSDESRTTLGVDGHFRNRNHKLAAPIADVGVLLNNFVLEIPRENQQVIRLCASDLIGRIYRDTSSWQKHPLLIRAAIDRVVKEIGADRTIVQKSIALGRRTVRGDPFSIALGLNVKFEQLAFCFFNLFSKTGVGLQPSVTCRFFPCVQVGHTRTDRFRGVFGMARKNSQGSAVSRELLDIKKGKAVCREYLLDAKEREIREMFVIYGVELILFHQLHQMRKLHRDDAPGLE